MEPNVKAKPKPKQTDNLKALRKAIKRKDKVTVVRTIKPVARGR